MHQLPKGRRAHGAKFIAPLSLASLVLVVASCETQEGAKPDVVSERLHAHLPPLLDGASDAMTQMSASAGFEKLGKSFDTFFPGTFDEGPSEPVPAADDDDAFNGSELADVLTESIFNDDNYLGGGIYSISAETICPDQEFEPEAFAECQTDLQQIDPRIFVDKEGAGLSFALLVGPNDARPLEAELSSTELRMSVDLFEAKAAAAHVGSVLGENFELPDTFEGVLRASFSRPSDSELALTTSVVQAVSIAGNLTDMGEVSLSLAATEALTLLSYNSQTQTAKASFDLNRTLLRLPFQFLSDEAAATSSLAIDLQGASAGIEVTESDFQIVDVGLGDGQSSVEFNDTVIFTVDLNSNSGRHFDLSAEDDTSGEPIVRFSPELDLAMNFNLQPLADAGEDVDSEFLDTAIRVQIASGVQAVNTLDASALRAVDGPITLTIDSEQVVVAPTQCLLDSETDTGETPLSGLSSGACPQ